MKYYAIIVDGHVSSVTSSETAITQDGYVEITAEQFADSSLIGKRYDPFSGEFTDVIYWSADTDWIEYKTTEGCLSTKLDLMDAATAAKADAAHTHSEYALTTHTHNYADADDIAALQTAINGKANTSHTHSQYANASDVAALETEVDGKADASHTHSQYAAVGHTHSDYVTNDTYTNGMSGKANASHTHAQSEISGLSDALGGKANTSHTHEQSAVTGLSDALAGKADASHTHTAAQVGAAASSHNHDSAYISKNLQMTADNGDISISWSGKNVVTEFTNLASGMYTAYAPAGATNNPNSAESFRFMIHKTGTVNYGWVMAYGAQGSVYTGYIDNGNWKGWRAIFEANPAPLWTGASYMTEVHTLTPTKTLSQCRNGWLLLWSDYDPGEGASNTDFYASVIFKRAYTGQAWAGGEWYCDIPSYSAGTATDSEQRVIKVLKVYDAKIEGTSNNSAAPRNDVVLRAIYEF